MSSAANEPQAPIDVDPVIGGEPDPGRASPYPADVAGIVRPRGEVGVLPLGGELDPIDSADKPVGEVGQLPGAVVGE